MRSSDSRGLIAARNADALLRAKVLATTIVAGCSAPGPRFVHHDAATESTLEIGRTGTSLRGVAGDATTTYAALTIAGKTTIEARSFSAGTARPGSPERTIVAWHTELETDGGPLARTGDLLVATTGTSAIALEAATGAVRWKLPLVASDWVIIAAIAAAKDGVVIGGSFAGTLRAGDRVVGSAGRSDGFVARVTAGGAVAWLVRVGGAGADAVQGVAASAERVAIAGTFASGGELAGQPFTPFDEHSFNADVFVAELDSGGKRLWGASFGGKADDTVAGVAIDARGRVVVAANARDTVHVGTTDIVARGPSDGLVTWWTPTGALDDTPPLQLGGPDFDGLRAIVATGSRIVVAGFYSGTMQLGNRALTAGGGDDAFVAALDESGHVVEAWPVGGEGREEVTALAPVPGGFIAGIAHTAAARVGDAALPSPADPLSGAALAVRAVRN